MPKNSPTIHELIFELNRSPIREIHALMASHWVVSVYKYGDVHDVVFKSAFCENAVRFSAVTEDYLRSMIGRCGGISKILTREEIESIHPFKE